MSFSEAPSEAPSVGQPLTAAQLIARHVPIELPSSRRSSAEQPSSRRSSGEATFYTAQPGSPPARPQARPRGSPHPQTPIRRLTLPPPTPSR